MCSAADHHVRIAASKDVAGLADGLGARGTCRQAVERRPSKAEFPGNVRKGLIGFLREFVSAGDVVLRCLEPRTVVDVA